MDIEEDIKILEKFKNNEMQRDKLERDSRCGSWKIGDIYKKIELNIAIDHILAEREEDKKRIQELEGHQEKFYNGELYTAKQLKQIEENQKKYFINKQKVKDYLEEEKERFEVYKKESETNETLKLGMYRHLGAKNMCEKILGIEKNIATLD